MHDTSPGPDEVAQLVDLSLERGRRRGHYHGPVTEDGRPAPALPDTPALRPVPAPLEPMVMPELRPGLRGLLIDAAIAIAHLIRKAPR